MDFNFSLQREQTLKNKVSELKSLLDILCKIVNTHVVCEKCPLSKMKCPQDKTKVDCAKLLMMYHRKVTIDFEEIKQGIIEGSHHLDYESEKILYDNLWDLYVDSDDKTK